MRKGSPHPGNYIKFPIIATVTAVVATVTAVVATAAIDVEGKLT